MQANLAAGMPHTAEALAKLFLRAAQGQGIAGFAHYLDAIRMAANQLRGVCQVQCCHLPG
jgi:hypothetical protein